MLDSLVRVTRRVDENHLVRIVMAHTLFPPNETSLLPQDIVFQAAKSHRSRTVSLVAHHYFLTPRHNIITGL